MQDRRWISALIAGLGWLVGGGLVNGWATEEAAVNAVLVSVNGEELTQSEVDRIIEGRMKMLEDRVPDGEMERYDAMFREQLKEEFVVTTLLASAADEKGFTPSDAEVDEYIEEMRAKLPPSLEFEQFLAIQGLDADNMREAFSEQLAIKRMVESELDPDEDVSEAELRQFYDEQKEMFSKPETVRARHILVKVEPDAEDAVKEAKREQIKAIRTQIVEGADFGELAREHSECPSGPQGGDLGEFSRGQMVPPFEEAAFSQPIGEVGDVVETKFGYHLIEVMERSEASDQNFEDVRDQIARQMEGSRRQLALKNMVNDLRSKAEITYPSE